MLQVAGDAESSELKCLLHCTGVIQHHKKLSVSQSVNLFLLMQIALSFTKTRFPFLEFSRIGFHLHNTITAQLLFWFINERGELSSAPLTHLIDRGGSEALGPSLSFPTSKLP